MAIDVPPGLDFRLEIKVECAIAVVIERHFPRHRVVDLGVQCGGDEPDRQQDGQGGEEELQGLLSAEELEGAPLLLLANKQDLPGALPAADVADQLGLQQLRGRQWHSQPSCATTGEGLQQGLGWLLSQKASSAAVEKQKEQEEEQETNNVMES